MSSWLSSALQTVREKSIDALDFVKKDLTEFTTTVKTDTEVYINKIKSQEVGDLGINRFVSKLSNSTEPQDTDEKHFQASSSYDRVHTEVKRLQNDESTYLADPTPIEAYEQWRQTSDFNVETRKGEIAQLLIDAPHVRSFYAHLVPAQTTHNDFWSRYYYRLHQIEDDEARRLQLLQRAKEICAENPNDKGKNKENDWEESDEESDEPAKIAEPIAQENPIETNSDNWEDEANQVDTVIKTEETGAQDDTIDSKQPVVEATTEKKGDNETDDDWEAWA